MGQHPPPGRTLGPRGTVPTIDIPAPVEESQHSEPAVYMGPPRESKGKGGMQPAAILSSRAVARLLSRWHGPSHPGLPSLGPAASPPSPCSRPGPAPPQLHPAAQTSFRKQGSAVTVTAPSPRRCRRPSCYRGERRLCHALPVLLGTTRQLPPTTSSWRGVLGL